MEGIHPLKTYRDQTGLKQRELAELLGVTRETVARWESGIRDVDQDLLPSVTAKTGIPAKELRPDLATLMETNAENAA